MQSRALGALNAALGEREGAKQAKKLANALDSFQAERWKDVKQVLTPMAQMTPEVAMIRELLGLALYRLGEWLKAADHLEAARRFDPASTVALPVLADCYRALQRHEAVDRLWKELRDASPDAATVAEGRIIASSSLADRGDLAGAIRLMEKTAKVPARPQEHHLRSWYVLADLYDRAGEVVKARNMFMRIRKFDKSFYDVTNRLADLGR